MKKRHKRNRTVLMTLICMLTVSSIGYKILSDNERKINLISEYEQTIEQLKLELSTVNAVKETLMILNEDYQSENSKYRIAVASLENTVETYNHKIYELEHIISSSIQYDANNYSRGSLENKPLDKYAIISEQELNQWISERAPEGSPFIGRADIFLEAAKQSELDPKYIIAHAALESLWGTSEISRDKNNFFGIAAYNHDPYNSAKSFGSFKEGIIQGAIWIKKNYIDEGQNTLSKMIYGNKAYCVDDDGTPSQSWIDKIVSIIL